MPSASAVRAGRAYVELFAEQKMFNEQLKNALKKVSYFGEQAARLSRITISIAVASAYPITRLVDDFSKFDDKMKVVQATTRATGKEFQKLEGLARQLGRDTSFTAQQVASGMVSLGRAGLSTQEIEDTLGNFLNLSRATATELPRAIEIATATMRGFNMQSTEAEHIVDVLTVTANASAQSLDDLGEAFKYVVPVAKSASMSIEDAAKATAILANMGIKGSMAATGIRNILLRMSQSSIQDLYRKELGVEVINPVTGALRSFGDVMNDVAKAVKNMPSGKKLGIFREIFGMYGLASGTAFASGVDFSEMLNKIDKASGEAQRIADDMDSGIGGTIRLAISKLKDVGLFIGEQVTPELMDLGACIDDIANRTKYFISENKQLLTTIIEFNKTLAASALTAVKFVATLAAGNHVLTNMVSQFAAFSPMIYVLVKGFNLLVKTIKGSYAVFNNVSNSIYKMIGGGELDEQLRELNALYEEQKNNLNDAAKSVDKYFANYKKASQQYTKVSKDNFNIVQKVINKRAEAIRDAEKEEEKAINNAAEAEKKANIAINNTADAKKAEKEAENNVYTREKAYRKSSKNLALEQKKLEAIYQSMDDNEKDYQKTLKAHQSQDNLTFAQDSYSRADEDWRRANNQLKNTETRQQVILKNRETLNQELQETNNKLHANEVGLRRFLELQGESLPPKVGSYSKEDKFNAAFEEGSGLLTADEMNKRIDLYNEEQDHLNKKKASIEQSIKDMDDEYQCQSKIAGQLKDVVNERAKERDIAYDNLKNAYANEKVVSGTLEDERKAYETRKKALKDQADAQEDIVYFQEVEAKKNKMEAQQAREEWSQAKKDTVKATKEEIKANNELKTATDNVVAAKKKSKTVTLEQNASVSATKASTAATLESANAQRNLALKLLETSKQYRRNTQEAMRNVAAKIRAVSIEQAFSKFISKAFAATAVLGTFVALTAFATSGKNDIFANSTDKQAEAARKRGEALKERQQLAQRQIDDLRKINEQQEKFNNESRRNEAARIIQDLTLRYGNLGLEIDKATGKVVGLVEAQKKLDDKQRGQTENQLEDEIKNNKRRVEGIKKRMEGLVARNALFTTLGFGDTGEVTDAQGNPIFRGIWAEERSAQYMEWQADIAELEAKNRELEDELSKLRQEDKNDTETEQDPRKRAALNLETSLDNAKKIQEVLFGTSTEQSFEDNVNNYAKSLGDVLTNTLQAYGLSAKDANGVLAGFQNGGFAGVNLRRFGQNRGIVADALQDYADAMSPLQNLVENKSVENEIAQQKQAGNENLNALQQKIAIAEAKLAQAVANNNVADMAGLKKAVDEAKEEFYRNSLNESVNDLDRAIARENTALRRLNEVRMNGTVEEIAMQQDFYNKMVAERENVQAQMNNALSSLPTANELQADLSSLVSKGTFNLREAQDMASSGTLLNKIYEANLKVQDSLKETNKKLIPIEAYCFINMDGAMI